MIGLVTGVRYIVFSFFLLLLPYAVIFFTELKSAGMGGVICGSDIKEKENREDRNRVERYRNVMNETEVKTIIKQTVNCIVSGVCELGRSGIALSFWVLNFIELAADWRGVGETVNC